MFFQCLFIKLATTSGTGYQVASRHVLLLIRLFCKLVKSRLFHAGVLYFGRMAVLGRGEHVILRLLVVEVVMGHCVLGVIVFHCI